MTFTITYRFLFHDQTEETFTLDIDADTLALSQTQPESLPDWTRLSFNQCPNCPLSEEDHPRCPLAVSLIDIMGRFAMIISHELTHVTVITEERIVAKDTTMQRAISSLMGLIIATSDCPHARFLRPMARFHLPLASEEETIFRATSTYMLAQYFLNRENKAVDLELDGLIKLYQNMQQVNFAVADRLRRASETDSSVNALIILDIYAKAMPFVIKKSLEEIRHIIEPLIKTLRK